MKIVIIDNQPIYRYGLASVLKEAYDYCQVIFLDNLTAKFSMFDALEVKVNLIIVGLNSMHESIPQQLQSYMMKENSVPVLALTNTNNHEQYKNLTKIGVRGIISKFCTLAKMTEKIKHYCHDKKFVVISKTRYVQIKKTPKLRNTSKVKSTTFNTSYHGDLVERSLYFKFKVSADEEHTFLGVENNNQQIDFEERVHHYLLLILARIKIQDQKNGYDPESQGWVEIYDLAKMLGLDIAHINIQIYRARQQINHHFSTGSCGFDIFQRRLGSIRISVNNIDIIRSGSLENSLQSVMPAFGYLTSLRLVGKSQAS